MVDCILVNSDIDFLKHMLYNIGMKLVEHEDGIVLRHTLSELTLIRSAILQTALMEFAVPGVPADDEVDPLLAYYEMTEGLPTAGIKVGHDCVEALARVLESVRFVASPHDNLSGDEDANGLARETARDMRAQLEELDIAKGVMDLDSIPDWME